MNSKFKTYGYSRSGMKRDGNGIYYQKDNEDCKRIGTYRGIFITADGMGGHLGAKFASHHATLMLYNDLSEIQKMISTEDVDDKDIIFLLEENVKNANIIINTIGKLPNMKNCGTTIDAVIINSDKIYGAHVGDGSVYYKSSSDDNVKRLTTIKINPYLNELDLEPIEKELLQSSTLENYVGSDNIKVETYIQEINPEDILLMTTDGFTKKVHPNEIKQALTGDDLSESYKQLIKYCSKPMLITNIVDKLSKNGYDISTNKLFNDDTTFILLKKF